ncbi:MAG TPA: OmpA family protein [Panacibacter sp.]|nr:OmpA family protein [Panacibacter sp.]
MKKNLTLLLCLFVTTGTFAQSLVKPKSSIGFSFGFADFQTPQEIKSTSLNTTLKNGEWNDVLKRMGPAFTVQYWRGLTSHLDISGTYSGIFLQNMPKTFQDPEAKYYQALEAAMNVKLLKESAVVNPFLTLGVGGYNYHRTYGAQLPAGLGIQFNPFHNEAHLLLQAQYKFKLSDNATDHLLYSFGLLVPVSKTKETKVAATPPPPPPPAPVDTDGDGIIDTQDKCPSVAGLAKYNGCPVPDTDADGINDEMDKCVTVAGLAKYDGCPIPDSDGDGINDEQDKCPTVAGLARYGGCPIPDTDGDGVNDEEDKCPNVAGPADNAGCPVIGIDAYKVVFKSGSAVLLPEGKLELDKAVKYLKENEGFDITIEGHTDKTGSDKINEALSAKRAAAVKAYFVKNGIPAERLYTESFGSRQPVADNKTVAGRKLNRRIEIKLKK